MIHSQMKKGTHHLIVLLSNIVTQNTTLGTNNENSLLNSEMTKFNFAEVNISGQSLF